MRTAILSDIHGNLTAFEAVAREIQQAAPDLVLGGGDLAHGGARPAEIVDRIRDLGWQAIAGNVDEMMSDPRPCEAFEYDLETEVRRLSANGIPQAAWTGAQLRSARPQLP